MVGMAKLNVLPVKFYLNKGERGGEGRREKLK